MRRSAFVALVLFAATSVRTGDTPPPDQTLGSIFTWIPTQQETGYRAIENIFPTWVIKAGADACSLPSAGDAFDLSYGFRGVEGDELPNQQLEALMLPVLMAPGRGP